VILVRNDARLGGLVNLFAHMDGGVMLEVFGAGVGRTGTLSLKIALEKLGFGPCHHMRVLLEQQDQHERIALWRRAAAGRAVDWAEVYRGFSSSTDWPGARFWREITTAFPDAKVILTVRDPDSWYESSMKTIAPIVNGTPPGMERLPKWLVRVLPKVLGRIPTRVARRLPGRLSRLPVFPQLLRMAREVILEGVFHNRLSDRKYAIQRYNEHNETVQKEIPSDRLLVFDVRDGWEPLCEFLGVPVPDEPFPHSNKHEEIQATVERNTQRGARARAR
jgi:hypothetical protein